MKNLNNTGKVLGLFCVFALLLTLIGGVNGVNAEEVKLDIIGHRVHKAITQEGAGGDIIEPWVEEHEQIKSVSWTPLEIGPLHERLFREATLPSSDVDVAYLLNTNAIPRMKNLLASLDQLEKEDSLTGFPEEFSQGMLDALTYDGDVYGIPIRAATHGFGWNKELANQRGLEGPPETPDEFYEYAKKLTFTQDDGTKVYGFLVLSHYYYAEIASVARMWDGDFITTDLEVVADEPPMINAMTMLSKMYENGYMPKNIPSIQHAEKQRMIQQKRVGMVFDVMGKIYNWGHDHGWKVAPYPLKEELQDKYKFGPAETEFWAMVIPGNSKNPELSWDFIKHLSTHESAVKMALNGNGPARLSVFEDERFNEDVPYANYLKQATEEARIPLPGFDKTPQARELIETYVERALLGKMGPEEAMVELADKLRNLSDQLH